jgi:thymidine kinase
MISLILGPMCSGKSSYLQTVYRKKTIAKKNVFVIKFKESRYNSPKHITNHDLQSTPANPFKALADVELPLCCEVVLIDEGQFFPDLSTYCEKWANSGIEVFVAALSSDFKKREWKSVNELLPKCEKVHTFSSVCVDCGNDAYFTRKDVVSELSLSVSTDQVDIGGIEKYSPVCRSCYNGVNKEDANGIRCGN